MVRTPLTQDACSEKASQSSEEPGILVQAYVGVDGHLELMHVARVGAGPVYAYHRFATEGTRSVWHASGTFRIGDWNPPEARASLIQAQRPDAW